MFFQKWLKIQEADWVPRTYLELEALPCILILSGAEPLGESLPRFQRYFIDYFIYYLQKWIIFLKQIKKQLTLRVSTVNATKQKKVIFLCLNPA